MIWDKDNYLVIDCHGQILGKIIQKVCTLIRGLDSVMYHPSKVYYQGKCVKLINVLKIKSIDPYRKVYSHTRFGGGFKSIFAKDLLLKNPQKYIKRAIKGQLPKNKSSHYLLKKVRVYS